MFLFARRFFLLPFVCLLVAGPFCFASSAAKSPEASISMLQKAVNTRDMALAEQYLDIDGVTAKAVDVIASDPAALQALGNDIVAATLALAMGGNEKANPLLKNLLQNEAREYVRHGVVSGAFAGTVAEGASTYGGLFKKAFRGGEKNKIVFGPATVRKRDGPIALVATNLAQGTKGRVYPLELRLEERDGVWRVVELANIQDFIQKSVKKDPK